MKAIAVIENRNGDVKVLRGGNSRMSGRAKREVAEQTELFVKYNLNKFASTSESTNPFGFSWKNNYRLLLLMYSEDAEQPIIEIDGVKFARLRSGLVKIAD